MHGNAITGAITALSGQIEAALLNGYSTAEMRRELATLEQRQRAEAAEAASEERARRAEQEAAERIEAEAKAAALASEVRARVEVVLASMPVPPPLAVRRFPDGSV